MWRFKYLTPKKLNTNNLIKVVGKERLVFLNYDQFYMINEKTSYTTKMSNILIAETVVSDTII